MGFLAADAWQQQGCSGRKATPEELWLNTC